MRLDRYVSKAFGISRKEAKRLILSGRVSVNGRVVKDPSFKVEGGVRLDGEEVERPKEKVYIMLNKPPGFVSSTKDVEPTVLDLVDHPRTPELFPVGRLDKDARGMIILTNDGDFTHRVISPKHHVEKEYEVKVEGDVKKALKLLDGVKLKDGVARALKVEIVDEETVRVVVDEGRNHLIKRMFASIGLKVKDLKRIRIGGLRLDVEEGKWRELSEEEVAKVLEGRRWK